jgi:hypothetical protein
LHFSDIKFLLHCAPGLGYNKTGVGVDQNQTGHSATQHYKIIQSVSKKNLYQESRGIRIYVFDFCRSVVHYGNKWNNRGYVGLLIHFFK